MFEAIKQANRAAVEAVRALAGGAGGRAAGARLRWPGAPPRVGLIMGSQSDWATLRHAAATLDELGIAHDDRIVSAHRTPERLVAYAQRRARARPRR